MNNLQPTYAEFERYQPRYAGIDETAFTDVVQDATAWVDAYIFPNVVDAASDPETVNAYKRSICAVIATERDYPDLHTKAYTVGKVHEELDGSGFALLSDAVAPYLSGSGLLCRWL